MDRKVVVVVIGGGFAGCAAAAAGRRAGAEVILLERTDTLGGLGLIGGSFRMSGQFTAHEEAIAMGAGDLPKAMDEEMMYSNRELPGQHHVSLYNCRTIGKRFHKILTELGVKVRYRSRVTGIKKSGSSVTAVSLQDGEVITGDAFVDATGTVGPEGNCKKYGQGCAMCVMRCPTYGGRISVSSKAGVQEMIGVKKDGTPGTYSAALTLVKESLSKELQSILEKEGSYLPPVPKQIVQGCLEKIRLVAPAVTPDHAETLTLTYMGYVNVVGLPYLTEDELRQIPGFENAIYFSPYTGWVGNSIRYMAVAPRDKYLKVEGVDNLFVAGEKIGGQPNGVTEALTTGVLAGHNSVRKALGLDLLELPRSTVIGDFVAFTAEHQQDVDTRYSYIWGPYFERMKQLGLYTTDITQIQKRIADLGLTDVFAKSLV